MELWAELRREHFVRGVSIKKLVDGTGLSRNTIRKALRSDAPAVYQREQAGSVLDPFKDEIHRLLRDDPRLSGVRVRGMESQDIVPSSPDPTVTIDPVRDKGNGDYYFQASFPGSPTRRVVINVADESVSHSLTDFWAVLS